MADTIKTGNYFYEHGYVMVSNLLIDYQDRLGITDDEFNFIVKVLRHKSGFKIHDANLSSTVSTKTLQRRRKSLVEKGYLEYRIIKSNDSSGNIITEGIVYDFTALDIALSQLASDLTEAKQETVEKKISIKKEIVVKKEDILEDFKAQYKSLYNRDYIISKAEQELIKQLNKKEFNSLKYIFEYYEENKSNLPDNFTPRIIFFVKTKWRLEQLVAFSEEIEERVAQMAEYDIMEEENKKAELEWEALIGDNEEDFTDYLRRTNTSLFVKKRNGMMLNVIEELRVVYNKYKGEKDAK